VICAGANLSSDLFCLAGAIHLARSPFELTSDSDL